MRQVTPKKLPRGMGWGVMAGPDAEAGETVQVTTRRGKTWEAELVAEVSPGVWSTDQTRDGPTRREKLEARADRREAWAESRDRKAAEAFDAADLSEAKTGIPFGQPILVGHHSERAHRKTIERAERKGFEGLEHSKMAAKHGQAAQGIRTQLRNSIYDDDVDAVERLAGKLAELETRRDRIKTLNKRIRAGESLDSLGLTEKEIGDLAMAAQWHGRKTFPPYVLSNLSGNIKRTRDRLAYLRGDA